MALTENTRGAGLMMVSMAAFTFNDVCMKALAGEIPLFQAIFMRGVLTTLFMFIVGRRMGLIRFKLPRKDWGLIALRTTGEIFATGFFLTALYNMPIANVTAILQALPLTIALAAALFLREHLGWRRIIAILVGLAGVMLIVRPGAAGFNTYSIYALAAVGFVTVRDLSSRRLSTNVPSFTVALIGAISVTTVFGLAATTGEWVPVSAQIGGLIALASLFIIGGYLASVAVMRVGEIGFTAPFRYTGLIWALILGWLVFAEWPDNWTLIGAAIVVATGVFTLYRERQARRRAARNAAKAAGIRQTP
ncbi:MAG: DMT family transporter [Rhodobacteraceae bacterium]|nr:DMT family transporter [Paracoccaceae bacterium]